MNWQHLRHSSGCAGGYLPNQLRRGGTLNAVLTTVLAVGLAVLAVPLLIGCFVIGLFVFPRAEPIYLLFAWDGMIVAFIFFWIIGLMSELQRTDSLSLSKFLHLPLSVSGVFFINYLSSLVMRESRLSLSRFCADSPWLCHFPRVGCCWPRCP